MPTRNINLTDYYDRFVSKSLASGRYKNASEVVRAGLRLLESREREEEAKLEALRDAFKVGNDAYDRGEYFTIDSDEDLDRFFGELAEQTDGPQT